MRFFSTAGLVRPDEHYAIPPLDRLGLCDVLRLIQRKQYFVVRAPHRSGKTSSLIALRDHLNGGSAGEFHCVYVNLEAAQAAGDDVAQGMRAVLTSVAEAARILGDDYPHKAWAAALKKMGPDAALLGLLADWCGANPTPLVLLLDDIDSLMGDTLNSVLRQLRAGYVQRPAHFPQSVALCGVHDVRDYRSWSSSGDGVAGGSPFNIVSESLRLGDFTKAETYALMEQHATESKQPFEEAAMAEVWQQTQGQPWLVNALCAQACFQREEGRDGTKPITKVDIQAAKEALVASRRTHLDQLLRELEDERVRRVMVSILSGGQADYDVPDLDYVRDHGLVDASRPRIANPIYAEMVPREIGYVVESGLDERAAWYVDAAGRLDMHKLLRAFSTFYGEQAGHWLGRLADYSEAGPQLILQAYLQRIVNGGGRIEREYGTGRGAVDIQVLWPAEPGQPSDSWTRIVVECKALQAGSRQSLDSIVERGVTQTLRYMAQCNAREGHLVVFDRREEPRHGDAREPTTFEREDGSVVVWHL